MSAEWFMLGWCAALFAFGAFAVHGPAEPRPTKDDLRRTIAKWRSDE